MPRTVACDGYGPLDAYLAMSHLQYASSAGVMIRRVFWLVALAVPGLCVVLGLLPKAKRKDDTASSIKLRDGRTLAYELRGPSNAKHVAFWNHGIISSRSMSSCMLSAQQLCAPHIAVHYH